MSRSLKIGRLFRSSSSDKKDSLTDEAPHRDGPGAWTPGAAPEGPADSATLSRDAELVSPAKGMKRIGLLSLRRKKKKARQSEEVFLQDDREEDPEDPM